MRLLSLALLSVLAAAAQPALQQPLADFDRLTAQLKSSGLLGEPVRVGSTAIVPFAKVSFGLGSAGLPTAFGGGMGAHTTALGVVIVEGDDVRLEFLPQEPEKPGILAQFLQAILDHKVTIIGNAVNLGSASGSLEQLTPMVTGLVTGITTIGNGLNVGSLNPPKPPPPEKPKPAAPPPASRP